MSCRDIEADELGGVWVCGLGVREKKAHEPGWEWERKEKAHELRPPRHTTKRRKSYILPPLTITKVRKSDFPPTCTKSGISHFWFLLWFRAFWCLVGSPPFVSARGRNRKIGPTSSFSQSSQFPPSRNLGDDDGVSRGGGGSGGDREQIGKRAAWESHCLALVTARDGLVGKTSIWSPLKKVMLFQTKMPCIYR